MIAPSFYPAYGAECLVNAKLVLAMLNKGWEVKVISHINKEYSFFDASAGSPWRRLDSIAVPIKSVESRDFRAYLQKLLVFFKTRHITNGMLWVEKCMDVAEHLLNEQHYDVIISRAIPEYSHLAAMYLSKKFNVPWIANWNDPVPNAMFLPPGGQGHEAKIKYYYQHFLNAAFQRASWHTFPSDRLRRYMCSYIKGNIDKKSSVVPHIYLESVLPETVSKGNVFTLCYTGGASTLTRNPEFIIRPVSELLSKGEIDDVRIVFVGDCQREVADIAASYGISDKVKSIFWTTYEESLAVVASSDVSLLIEEDCAEGIYLPSKLSDYVSVNNPILAVGPKEGTVMDLLERFGGGVYSHCRDYEKTKKNIKALYDQWRHGNLRKLASIELTKYFSESVAMVEYQTIFSKILH